MFTKQLTYHDLDVRLQDVYEAMDFHGSSDDPLCAEVKAMLDDISRWLRPRLAYTVLRDCPFTNEAMGRIVSRQLRGSEAYALFVCTAGVEFQQLMDRLTDEGDMVRLYIAHSIGSVLAERCADQMERVLQSSIDKLGWHRTNRFSPGYCGWHVSQQQLLFPLLEGHDTGVLLTPSSLMMPIKSVSGIIGLGHDVRYLEYTCGLCDKKDCYKKRKKKPLLTSPNPT